MKPPLQLQAVQQQKLPQQELQQQMCVVLDGFGTVAESLPMPPPRYDKEVFKLLGDSEDAIRGRREIEDQRLSEIERQRRSEIERQRSKVDMRAYLENSWHKIDRPAP